MFQFYESMIQRMYFIRFETWTEYDLPVSESYFWFAQIKRRNKPSPPSWMNDSLKIINWVWSTRFEILFPIRSNKTVNQNHDFESDSDSGKSNTPLVLPIYNPSCFSCTWSSLIKLTETRQLRNRSNLATVLICGSVWAPNQLALLNNMRINAFLVQDQIYNVEEFSLNLRTLTYSFNLIWHVPIILRYIIQLALW